MILTQSAIRQIEQVQSVMGGFILQTPPSTVRAATWIEAGLKPISLRIQACHIMFAWSAANGKNYKLTSAVFQDIMLDGTDPWAKEIAKITRVIGPLLSFAQRYVVKKAMRDYTINSVLAVKQAQPSLDGMSIPTNWFHLQPHVSDSTLSKTLNRTRAGNLRLGNREFNVHGSQYKMCPLCPVNGLLIPLNEVHVLILCPMVAFEREASGLHAYILARLGILSATEVLRLYLGGDGCNVQGLMQRSRLIWVLVSRWLDLVGAL